MIVVRRVWFVDFTLELFCFLAVQTKFPSGDGMRHISRNSHTLCCQQHKSYNPLLGWVYNLVSVNATIRCKWQGINWFKNKLRHIHVRHIFNSSNLLIEIKQEEVTQAESFCEHEAYHGRACLVDGFIKQGTHTEKLSILILFSFLLNLHQMCQLFLYLFQCNYDVIFVGFLLRWLRSKVLIFLEAISHFFAFLRFLELFLHR